MDLLRAAAAAPAGPAVDSLRAAVLPWFRDGVASGTPLAPPQPPVTGRYVRLVRPGRATVLSVTEVQVFSGGENVAMKGTATQSSTLAGGATGGHAPRAIDGGLEPDLPAGTDPLKGTVQFTSPEQDPWWELDLGAERPIDTIALWAASADTRNGVYLSVARRQPQAGLRPGRPAAPGADVPGRHRRRPDHPAADGGDRDAARHARPRSRDRAAAGHAGDQAGAAAGGAGGDPEDAGRRVAEDAARARRRRGPALPRGDPAGAANRSRRGRGVRPWPRPDRAASPTRSAGRSWRRSSRRCSSASSASRPSRRR